MAGDKYEGSFKNDHEEGEGVKIFHGHPIFLSYSGYWVKGHMEGKGIACLYGF
jgi:MORN repeat